MRKAIIVLLVLLLSVSFLAGCGGSTTTATTTTTTSSSTTSVTTSNPTTTAPSTTQPTATTTAAVADKFGGTLKIMLIAGPQTPGGVPSEIFGPDATSAQFCMEPLLRGDKSGNAIPWLAESYDLAEDRLSITFTLRKGVKFHDGTEFNAEVAKWNLDSYIASPTNQYWASSEVIDDYTVKVNFRMWVNTIITSFTGNAAWMVSKDAFDKNGIDWARNNPVGTGPFIFKSFQRDESYKFTRNLNYWMEGKPYLDAVEVLFVADSMTQKAAMQSGEAHMLQTEAGKLAKDLQSLGFQTVFKLVTVYSLMPDTAHSESPFAEQKVREAVEYSINREAIANAFSYGFWEAQYQIPYPDSPAFNPNFSAREYDPERARALLAEAGYPEGFTTTILNNPSIIDRNIAVALQSNLAAINITAELSFPANMGKFIGDTNSLTNILVMQPVMGAANYNSTWMFFLGPDAMWNKNWLPSPEFNALKNASNTAPAADPALIRAATDQLSEEASVIPFMLAGLGWIMQSTVSDSGFDQLPSTDVIRSEQIWLTEK